MPRSSARYGILLLAGVVFAGCKPPPAQPVSIDLARLLSAERFEVAGSPPLPVPPKPAAAVVQGIPGHAAQALRDPSRASRGSVKASLERQQQEALATLERRLREYYRLQAEAFELEQNHEGENVEKGLYDAATARIRAAFEEYADARAPFVAQLAVLVGFPDPNPESIPPKVPLRPAAQAQFDKSKRLREQIRTIDEGFDVAVAEILGSAATEMVAHRQDVLLRVHQFRDEMNRRAEREAQAEVRTSVKELGLQLTDPSPVVVPASPAKVVRIPAEAPLPPPPQVPSVGIPRGLADRRRLMEHELNIWLGLNRFRLAKGGRDMTQDFQAWREKYRAGL